MDQQFRATIRELLKDSRAADKVDKELATAMQGLISRPEWQSYYALLQRQIETRGTVILAPAEGVDGAMLLEHVKGTMRGLLLAQNLPSLIINAMQTSASATDGEDDDE